MRPSKSRQRNKPNRNRTIGNVVNRVFDSSGPEGKVRGTPQQIIEKYNQLARDAHLAGDRVASENFQQHAEHYLRLLGEAQREQDARREDQERLNRDRQTDRDREFRQPMRDGDDAGGMGGFSENASDTPAQTDGYVDADDVQSMDQASGDDDSPLVDTPESREAESASAPAKRPRRPRTKRAPKAAEDRAGDNGDGPAEAAE